MSEKPIIFNGQMVRAILNTKPGVWPAEPLNSRQPWKWQTRRVVSPQPPEGFEWSDEDRLFVDTCGSRLAVMRPCPYEDRLWVRETWAVHQLDRDGCKEFPNILYRADSSTRLLIDDCVWKYNEDRLRWRSSRFMPRWASRITLELKHVRVERLLDISYEDCMAEGVHESMLHGWPANISFYAIWNGLNEKCGFGVDKNPFVWVLDFMRVE